MQHPTDVDKLLIPRFAYQYSVEVSNRFEAMNSSEDVEESWQQFSTTLLSAAQTVLGKKRRKKKKWISPTTLDIVEQCREARLNGNTVRYRDLKKARRKNIRRDKAVWLNNIANSAEKDFRHGNLRAAYKGIKELCAANKKSISTPLSTPLITPDGSTLTDPHTKLACWRDHYEKSLCRPAPPTCARFHNFANSGVTNSDISLEPPSIAEVTDTIKKLPTGRAPGADGIVAEMLKSSINESVTRLQALFDAIWSTERIPQDWKQGVIIPIYKNKGNSHDPSNYRPITLLSVPSKVFTSILLNHIRSHLISARRPEQAGFTPSRSTTDCILALRTLAQQRREYRKVLYAAYIDLKGAFDSLDRSALWLLLQGIGTPDKYISLLRDLYSDTTCRVRAEGSLSDPFTTKSGVRQGCVAAPNLFNVAVDYWVNNALEHSHNFGVDYNTHITDLCYADDVVVFAEFTDTIADALTALHEEASPLGLQINWSKTKIQSLSDFTPPPQQFCPIADQEIETVTNFIYLGSKITSDCHSDAEIWRRIELARSSFG